MTGTGRSRRGGALKGHVLPLGNADGVRLALAAVVDVAREAARVRWQRGAITATVGGAELRRPMIGERGGATRARSRVAGSWASRQDRSLWERAAARRARWLPTRLYADIDAASLQPPLILATVHNGPIGLFVFLLLSLRHPTAIAMEALPGSFASYRNLRVRQALTEAQRSAAFIDAVRTLRRGGFAFLAVDGNRDGRAEATVTASVLGRDLELSNGAFALSRATGAPILPMVIRWKGRHLQLISGDPIAPDDATKMAAQLGSWLGDHLREHPAELSPELAWRLGIPFHPAPLEQVGRLGRRLKAKARSARRSGRA